MQFDFNRDSKLCTKDGYSNSEESSDSPGYVDFKNSKRIVLMTSNNHVFEDVKSSTLS